MPHTQPSTSNSQLNPGPLPLRRQLARKQAYTSSCGAAALLCAAKELGVQKMPLFAGSFSAKQGIDTLELNTRCESDLYMITGNCMGSEKGRAKLHKAGYSMPDKIVLAGRLLGLSMRVEKDQSLLASVLNGLYPKIEKELNAMGCPVVPPLHALKFNELRLEALACSIVGVPIGLHWVVHRPDGSYMDPRSGENYADFSDLTKGTKQDTRVMSYYRSGISIVVSGD